MTTHTRPTALVTGGSSGIGLEIVRALSGRGMDVLTCGRREVPPEPISALPGVEYCACDLTSARGVDSLAALVDRRGGRLDSLFNNAGIQVECRVDPDLSWQKIEAEVATNLVAPIALTSALVPALAQARGHVVNLSSGLALAPKAASPIYCATKAGLSNFSRSLSYQLEEHGITVVDVVTPLVKTPMTEGRHEGAIAPENFVRQMLAQIDAGKRHVFVGKARLLPPLLRLVPSLAYRIMRNA